MTFNNLDALFKHIEKDVQSTLKSHVAPVVKEHISDEVVNTVYSEGTPLFYDRRGEVANYVGSGSLRDPNEMEDYVEGNTLYVEDNASPKRMDTWGYNSSLAEVIEYGTDGDGWWQKPRRFMENAKTKLSQDSEHVEAMRKGLSEKGYIVK